TERLCSKCANKAEFFLGWVYSQESAIDYFNESRAKLAEKGFWPRGLQHLEDYCNYLDNVKASASNKSLNENIVKNPDKNKIIVQDSVDLEKNSRDNFIKSLFKSDNTVAKILTVIALIIFILGFIVGLVILFTGDLPFGLVLSYWAGSFVSGMFFISFAEIIKLLQNISKK
ncbi:MAG: hypothetical protein WCN92_06645, partial [Eubacteriales bacterium]